MRVNVLTILVCVIFLWSGVLLGGWASDKMHERETRLADCQAAIGETGKCDIDDGYGRLVLDAQPGQDARIYWKNQEGECWEVCTTAKACETQALLHNTECP